MLFRAVMLCCWLRHDLRMFPTLTGTGIISGSLMHPNTSGQRSLYRSYPSCAQLSGAPCLPPGICRDARRVATRGEGHAYAHHVMNASMTPGGTHAAGGTVDRRSVLRGDTIMHRTLCGTVGVLAALTLWMVGAAPALARVYTFTKVADSAGDGFDPFSFE